MYHSTQRYLPASQAPLLAYVGRLTGQKGMDVLLSSLPALLNSPPRPLAGVVILYMHLNYSASRQPLKAQWACLEPTYGASCCKDQSGEDVVLRGTVVVQNLACTQAQKARAGSRWCS